jgi:Animal haem peroxidase
MTAVQNQSPPGRVLRDATHGHRVPPPETDGVELELAEVTTPFDYLFESLEDDPEAHLPADTPETIAAVVANLKELGKKMVEPDPPFGTLETGEGNSTIPAVHTYLGQFIDHDITARTDRRNEVGHVTDEDLHPVDPDTVKTAVFNERVPALDLDSVYGDGPTFPGGPETDAKDIYDGIKLKVGQVALVGKEGQDPDIPGVRIPLQNDLDRDLPRGLDGDPSKANIADGRNDENLIVAQLHLAFLRFHNATVEWVRRSNGYDTDQAVFERARELVRWHYQWLVVHDYLATVALPGVVDDVLLNGNAHYAKRDDQVWMPLEFSVAAFRFGHTMVRGSYDYNRNFGSPGRVLPTAPFSFLFAFTGGGGFRGQTDVLPFNWVIEWDRFVEKDPRSPAHFTRKIDTRLADALGSMVNQSQGETEPAIIEILEHLAVRNLLRGYQLSIPTGQAIANLLGLAPLTEEELTEGNSDELNTLLTDSGFLQKTPLWYYVLKEAEVQAGGNSLGEVGSRIVAETLIGQLRNDPGSYLAQAATWVPEDGVLLPDGRPILTIKDFFRFAGVLPTRP